MELAIWFKVEVGRRHASVRVVGSVLPKATRNNILGRKAKNIYFSYYKLLLTVCLGIHAFKLIDLI